MHRGTVTHERASLEGRRFASRADLVRAEWAHLLRRSDLACRLDHVRASLEMLPRRRRVHVAGLRVPGIDAVGGAEVTDGGDAPRDRPAGPLSAIRAVQRNEAVELIPPSAGKAPVAPARSAAADVLLQDHDAE